MSTAPTPSSRSSLIARVTQAAISYPLRFLAGAAVVSAISIWLASGLEIRSNFEELLPSDIPSVAHVKELIRRVGGDGSVLIEVESKDGKQGLAAAKALAPKLAQDLLALGKEQIRSVQWTMSPVSSWYEGHWPLFASLDDLRKARDAIRAEKKKRVGAANPLAVDLSDDDDETASAGPGSVNPAGGAGAAAGAGTAGAAGAAPASDPDRLAEWLDPKKPLPREQVAARFAQFEDGFMVNPADQSSLTLLVRPAGTSLGVHEARLLIDKIENVIKAHQPEIDAGHLRVGLGGSTRLFIEEYEAITQDVFGTALLCFSLVIASILLFFRDLRSTASLGLAILVAVASTFGMTRLVIGYLNTQTAFLGVIVAGNGINYGLIYLARVKQLRRMGVSLGEACVEGALTTARATLLASAATSVSFGTLIIAANRGFRHFGFIGGIGMLLCWLSTFTLVPAFLSLWEKVHPYRAPATPAPERAHVPGWLLGLFARPQVIVALFAMLTVAGTAAFLRYLPGAMERNLDNLSNDPPKGKDQLYQDNRRAQASLGKSIAGTIALLDSRDEADEFCDVIRQRMKEPPASPTAPSNARLIDSCETISAVLPRQQPEKLALIKEIGDELGDSLLSRLSPDEARRLREVRDQLRAQRPLSIEEVPAVLLDPFRERDGSIGRLAVVTAKPQAELELGPNLKAFVKAVRNVPVRDKIVEATGSNVIFADLLDDIDKEGPRTTFLSFGGVCLLVFLYFRKLRTSLEVLGSLFIGVLLMGGAAAAINLKINFFNFIAFPITFGIAIDYGANVAARVHARSGDVLASLAEVGPAVALCSWTSIIGYGSLLFSLNRALRSFGWYAMIGEVTTITTALVLLPALLILAERSRKPAPSAEPIPGEL